MTCLVGAVKDFVNRGFGRVGDAEVGSLAAMRTTCRPGTGRSYRPGAHREGYGPSIGRMLRQEDAVMAATGPRALEQAVAELTGAEVYWALNEVRSGLWFE